MAKSPKISASHEPGGLIVHISGLLPSLSPAEQRVARLVVADPADAARRTITDLATAAETSEATVIRFCRSVGMNGYPQLRIRLAAEAARRVEPLDARVVGGDIPPGADLAQIIATIAFNDARAVEETAEQLDPAVCERVVEAIGAAGRIDVYGAGASGFVASDFQQKLHRIGRIAFYFPDVHTALTSAALLGRGDVAGRHLPHRHHVRRDRGAGAGPGARRHHGGAHQLPPLTDHRGRGPRAHHRRPGDDLPVRRDGQPAGPAHRG